MDTKKITWCAMIAMALPSAFPLRAQQLPQARDPSEQMRQEMEIRRREELLRFSDEPILKEQGTAPSDGRAIHEEGPAFMVHQIHFEGEDILLKYAERAVGMPWQERPLGVHGINLLLERINKALIDAGYVTSRAYVGPQNLGSGVLRITLVAGRIQAIVYNGERVESTKTAIGVKLSMSMKEGDILRLQDIEQAVDQLNRLRVNNAEVQIKPGTQNAGSVIEFTNNPLGKRGDYGLSLDNSGSSSTGRWRLQFSADYGNLFGAMERLNAGLTTSRDTNAVYAAVSLPLGYNTITLTASASEYQNLVGDIALVYGRSTSAGASWNKLLWRDQSSKTALDLALTKRQSKREINNAALTPQALTVARWGINRLQRKTMPLGMSQWIFDAGWTCGLKWLGADKDTSDLPSGAARAQFDKVDISISVDAPVQKKMRLRSRLAGQWSNDPLYGSEQIYAGGVSSVRGLSESAMAGDEGASLRNELAWQGAPAGSFFGLQLMAEPYVFLDGATVKTKSDDRWQHVISAGVGARIMMAQGNAEVVIGGPLRKSSYVQDRGVRVDLRLSYWF